MEKGPGSHKTPVLFPFLIEEPKHSNQDAINQSFLNGVMNKWPDKQSRLIKNAFPPTKNVLQSSHGREQTLKGFHSTTSQKEIQKSYSCPNIVDMSKIIFYHDRVQQNKPRRIINGFFPNKIRSVQGGLVNDGASQNSHRGRTATHPPQVGMCLGVARKDSRNLTGISHEPHANSRTTFLHGPKSTSRYPEERLDVRRTHSCWPVRNGSPSPWLQRFKLKKRAATSYSLQKPPQDCNEVQGDVSKPKRSQEYVNLSSAVILDAF